MAKLKVGDVLTLRETSLATDGFTAGEKVTVEHIEDGPGELNIEISNEAGEVGYCSVGHLDVEEDENLAEIMDSIRYGSLARKKAAAAVIGTILLLERCGDADELTDFKEGDLVEVVEVDPVANQRFGIEVGDYAYCLCAAGGGNALLTNGEDVFAAKCKLALSAEDNPVDERRLP